MVASFSIDLNLRLFNACHGECTPCTLAINNNNLDDTNNLFPCCQSHVNARRNAVDLTWYLVISVKMTWHSIVAADPVTILDYTWGRLFVVILL